MVLLGSETDFEDAVFLRLLDSSSSSSRISGIMTKDFLISLPKSVGMLIDLFCGTLLKFFDEKGEIIDLTSAPFGRPFPVLQFSDPSSNAAYTGCF